MVADAKAEADAKALADAKAAEDERKAADAKAVVDAKVVADAKALVDAKAVENAKAAEIEAARLKALQNAPLVLAGKGKGRGGRGIARPPSLIKSNSAKEVEFNTILKQVMVNGVKNLFTSSP